MKNRCTYLNRCVLCANCIVLCESYNNVRARWVSACLCSWLEPVRTRYMHVIR